MRKAAAQCELEGPRMTGPMTSLKMLIMFWFVFSSGEYTDRLFAKILVAARRSGKC